MKCTDCVHCDVCRYNDGVNEWCKHPEICQHFKDKSKFVELPCRCQDCVHSVPLDNNCVINTSMYLHCNLQRGDETKNVWHKYKKYYKDYSIVERDGFCDNAERPVEQALKERERNETSSRKS